MENLVLFHGSVKEIKKPVFGFGNPNNDYGLGFYCTQDVYAAREWANRFSINGIINKYQLDVRGLNILDLTDKSKYNVLNWIAILIYNRKMDSAFYNSHKRAIDYLINNYHIDTKKYDIVIGYRADDSYFRFPLAFLSNEITVEKIEEIYMLGFLGIQVAIMSEKAMSRLKFIKSENVKPIYKEKYIARMVSANNRYNDIIIHEQYSDGNRLIDLIKKENK